MSRSKLIRIFSFFLIFFSLLGHAETQDLYAFHSPQKEAEFNDLLKDLRCLVCQNQDLHDSQTPFAEGLRQQIRQWVIEGKSQKEIMTQLTSQYGEDIAFQPPLKTNTALLWIAPFVFFFFCILFLFIYLYKHTRSNSL